MGAAVIAVAMSSCSGRQRAKNSGGNTPVQELSGAYTGTLPCASCPGIETRVDLNSDLTYTIQTRYIGRSDEVSTQSGTFKWDSGNSTLTFDSQLLGQCLLEGNTLYVLVDGRKNTGQNAENYMLVKVDQDLVEKYWKLIELHGNPVTPANGSKEAHITFHIDGNRFSGDAGCNRIMGSYQTRENYRIAFSQTAATQMMCIDMEIESNFLQVLETADSYLVQNDTLTLNRARMAPLARFIVVYLR